MEREGGNVKTTMKVFGSHAAGDGSREMKRAICGGVKENGSAG